MLEGSCRRPRRRLPKNSSAADGAGSVNDSQLILAGMTPGSLLKGGNMSLRAPMVECGGLTPGTETVLERSVKVDVQWTRTRFALVHNIGKIHTFGRLS